MWTTIKEIFKGECSMRLLQKRRLVAIGCLVFSVVSVFSAAETDETHWEQLIRRCLSLRAAGKYTEATQVGEESVKVAKSDFGTESVSGTPGVGVGLTGIFFFPDNQPPLKQGDIRDFTFTLSHAIEGLFGPLIIKARGKVMRIEINADPTCFGVAVDFLTGPYFG